MPHTRILFISFPWITIFGIIGLIYRYRIMGHVKYGNIGIATLICIVLLELAPTTPLYRIFYPLCVIGSIFLVSQIAGLPNSIIRRSLLAGLVLATLWQAPQIMQLDQMRKNNEMTLIDHFEEEKRMLEYFRD